MYYKEVIRSIAQALVLTVVTLFIVDISTAEVRSSASYSMQSDSINIAGGRSDSDGSKSYVQESTVGEIATGRSSSDGYSLRAGYQQMQEVYLSLSTPTDVTMDTNLLGLTGGTSNGSTTFTVVTDGPTGYELTIAAENDPAMQRDGGGGSIADLDEGAEADYTFVVTAGEASFGFSPEGVDITQVFLNTTGSTCGTGSLDHSLRCWAGLATTSTVIASGDGPNQPDGATTTVNFRVGIGSGAGVLSGVYIATTTITALPL